MYLEYNNEFIAQYIEDEEEEVSYDDFMSSRGLLVTPKPWILSAEQLAQMEADKAILLSMM